MNSSKRKDIDDIKDIIKKLIDKKIPVTNKSIAEQLGQTASNVQRILATFNFDLSPYKTQQRLISNQERQVEIENYIKRLNDVETFRLTIPEIMKLTGFDGSEKEFKKIVKDYNIPFKSKTWYIHFLSQMDTSNYTLQELFKLCNLDQTDMTLPTFRARLYDNGIPYSKAFFYRREHSTPREVKDEIKDFLDTNEINPQATTSREIYGNYDIDMPYGYFRQTLKRNRLITKDMIRIKP